MELAFNDLEEAYDSLVYNDENEIFVDEKYIHIYIKHRHWCYLLRSLKNGRTYIGYTTNFIKRLRQHNGEIVGGAKKTRRSRPWEIIYLVTGFSDHRSALRFEFRWQKSKCYSKAKRIQAMKDLTKGLDKGIPWPQLTIYKIGE